ncbi:MAG: hypothetical protein ACI9J4_000417 [Paraglaciecola sp.]|jgi:hypothetical protein
MPTTIKVGDAVNAIMTLTFAGNGFEVGIFLVKENVSLCRYGHCHFGIRLPA